METKKNQTILYFTIVLVIACAVFLFNITLLKYFSDTLLLVGRILSFLLFLLVGRLLNKRLQPFGELSYTFAYVSLSFLVVSFITIDIWGLKPDTPMNIAFAKMIDSVVISLVLIISFLLRKYRMTDIYLAGGRLWRGIIIGIITFFIMALVAEINFREFVDSDFIAGNLIWILLFIFFNAFMEELLFRGIFLKQLNRIFKPVWSILLTSIVFAVAHLQVTYNPDALTFSIVVFALGLIWGFLTYYTKSIIASVLFHAGSDLVIIIPIYLSLGAEI